MSMMVFSLDVMSRFSVCFKGECIAFLYSVTSKFNDVVPCMVNDSCFHPEEPLELLY